MWKVPLKQWHKSWILDLDTISAKKKKKEAFKVAGEETSNGIIRDLR